MTVLAAVAGFLFVPAAAQKTSTAADYDFTGYANKDLLAKVYLGDLDEVWASHIEPTQAPAASVGALRKHVTLNGLGVAYHSVYWQACKAQVERGDPIIRTIATVRGGLVIDSSSTSIRARFGEGYGIAAASVGSLEPILAFGLTQAPSQALSWQTQMQRFLKESGCESPTTKRFEKNLDAALKGGKGSAALCQMGMFGGALNDPKACSCVRGALKAKAYPEDVAALDKKASRELFMLTLLRKDGLSEDVSKCVR